MSYLKDNIIIDFLVEVERLSQKSDSKLSPIYNFVLGFVSESYLKEPKKLAGLITGLKNIQQYEEEFQAITESQRRKIFLSILVDTRSDIEQKMFEAMSDDVEESKEIDKAPVSKERQTKCRQLYGESEDILNEHLAFVEEHERLEALDILMWGFFCAFLDSKVSPKAVFEKIFTLRQSQLSGLLNHNQKMRVYIKLYNDWGLDLNESFAKLLENPNLGSKPLSSLVVNEDQMSKMIAEQMALEEKIELEKARIEQEQKDNEDVMCNICLLDLYDKDEDVFFMDTCAHCFHESCLTKYLDLQVQDAKFPILCADESCQVEFTTVDLNGLMTRETLEKYHEFSLKSFFNKHGKDMSCCPTPGCNFAFFLDPDEKDFKCHVCSKSYCLTCRDNVHEGDCRVDEFLKVAQKLSYKACPHCKFWVEKTEGCRHMVCRCGEEFCYDCGQDWEIDCRDGCLGINDGGRYENGRIYGGKYYENIMDKLFNPEPEAILQPNYSFDLKHQEHYLQQQRAQPVIDPKRFAQLSRKKLYKKTLHRRKK